MAEATREIRVVVNADDLGYAQERNRGIFEAIDRGVVTSASILANGLASAEAVESWRKRGGSGTLSLGLHVNLTEGKPLADPRDIPSLLVTENLEDRGQSESKSRRAFRGKFGFGEAVRNEKVAMPEVLIEVRAQLMWFFDKFGRNPTHVDGHNHIHVLPGVSAVIASLCHERSIRWIRMPLEDMDSPLEDRKQDVFCKQVVKNAKVARPIFASFGLRMVDRFAGMKLSGKVLSRDRILKHLDTSCRQLCCKGGCFIEIMTHPGYPSRTGDEFSRSPERLHELQVLTDPKLTKAMMKMYKLSPFPTIEAPSLRTSKDIMTVSRHPTAVPVHYMESVKTEIKTPVRNLMLSPPVKTPA
uniref:Carbohydrate deacetylase n=1 Tax=Lotharella oceanica TaxID=641309 RepID=A0A7S2TNZ0_9EUKA|mmetsp:Transcript_20216/g.38036  ORF Transcript_20216/g.38036 Transcript_20216/m.38036 type:complete len:357 (+) Transcript_20216:82-1152(+)